MLIISKYNFSVQLIQVKRCEACILPTCAILLGFTSVIRAFQWAIFYSVVWLNHNLSQITSR